MIRIRPASRAGQRGNDLSYSLQEIAAHVGGSVEGSADVSIQAVAGLEDAGPGDLTFLAHPRYRDAVRTTKATAILASPDVECPDGLAIIRIGDPYGALQRILVLFDPGPPEVPAGVHPAAVVSEDAHLGDGAGVGPCAVIEAGARLGAGARVGAGAYVGELAELGGDCYLHPHVFLGRRCVLGDRVMVQAGAVIGSDGFGYAFVEGHYRRIPQIGIVVIGDDVEIGANACIDRATLGATRIAAGTKIDNLVQIAHNVAIAEDSALAAQSGVAGSTRLGKGVRLGGQAGLVGHLRVGDGAQVGAQAGVIGDIPPGVTVSGYPARPHHEAMRAEAALRRLPDLARRVRALEKRRDRDEKP
ncbi:MAG: UDP-3-O-(3-hydroxymyristoyl)glucosamine N-acyltransferase [Gaiellales bacterium]